MLTGYLLDQLKGSGDGFLGADLLLGDPPGFLCSLCGLRCTEPGDALLNGTLTAGSLGGGLVNLAGGPLLDPTGFPEEEARAQDATASGSIGGLLDGPVTGAREALLQEIECLLCGLHLGRELTGLKIEHRRDGIKGRSDLAHVKLAGRRWNRTRCLGCWGRGASTATPATTTSTTPTTPGP